MSGKIIKYLIVISVVCGFVAWFLLKGGDSVSADVHIDGILFKVKVYDPSPGDFEISRSDKSPELFDLYDWLPPGTLALGGSFLAGWDNEKLKSLFESPSGNPIEHVAELISRYPKDSVIKITRIMKIEFDGYEYVYLSLVATDFPDYIQYALVKKTDRGWVVPSSEFDPYQDLRLSVAKLQNKVDELIRNKKIHVVQLELGKSID